MKQINNNDIDNFKAATGYHIEKVKRHLMKEIDYEVVQEFYDQKMKIHKMPSFDKLELWQIVRISELTNFKYFKMKRSFRLLIKAIFRIK